MTATSPLSHHYGVLTVWERLPLFVAAVLRQDEAEARRLGAATPATGAGDGGGLAESTPATEVADCRGLVDGVRHIIVEHLLGQFETMAELLWVVIAMNSSD